MRKEAAIARTETAEHTAHHLDAPDANTSTLHTEKDDSREEHVRNQLLPSEVIQGFSSTDFEIQNQRFLRYEDFSGLIDFTADFKPSWRVYGQRISAHTRRSSGLQPSKAAAAIVGVLLVRTRRM